MVKLGLCAAIAGLCSVVSGATTLLNFESVALGSVPSNWEVASMGKASPLASFGCAVDTTAPGSSTGNHVMKITGYDNSAVYADCHICWTSGVSFKNGTIEVDSKAAVDTNGYAGGIAWRIQDKDNYYAIRYSCSESGISLFKIVGGKRTSIGSGTSTFKLVTWYHVKISHSGSSIAVSVNGNQLISVTDTVIKVSGGVGLFQRGNATVSSWDNLSISTDGAGVSGRPEINNRKDLPENGQTLESRILQRHSENFNNIDLLGKCIDVQSQGTLNTGVYISVGKQSFKNRPVGTSMAFKQVLIK